MVHDGDTDGATDAPSAAALDGSGEVPDLPSDDDAAADMDTDSPPARTEPKRSSFSSYLGALRALQPRRAPLTPATRRQSVANSFAAATSSSASTQATVRRSKSVSRAATARRPSMAALGLATGRSGRNLNELETKTAAYELMMQRFQLRKVDAPVERDKALRAAAAAAEANHSTSSEHSNTPAVVRRKTFTDFSRRLGADVAASEFDDISPRQSAEDTGGGHTNAGNALAKRTDADESARRRTSIEKSSHRGLEAGDTLSAQISAPSVASDAQCHDGLERSPRDPTLRLDRLAPLPTTPNTSRLRSTSRFSLHHAVKQQRRRWRRRLHHWHRRLLTPFSPIGTVGKLRAVIMTVVFVLQVVYLPVVPVYMPRGSARVTAINIAFELAFLADFALTFNMAYYDVKAATLVRKRQQIAWHYVSTWLLIDALSSVPVDLIIYAGAVRRSGDGGDNLAQPEADTTHVLFHTLFRLPRLYHVLESLHEFLLLSRKLSNGGKGFVAWLFYSRYAHLMRIVRLILLVGLTAHYMACGWHMVSRNDPAAPNAVPPGASVLEQYVADVYYSVLLIQGQGDSSGTSMAQNVFSIVAVLLGSVILAIVFGNVAILVSNFHANSTNYQRKMEVVFATMNKMQLPLELRQRIHQYYDHLWQEYESLDGDIVKFANELSHTLALEVGLYKYMNLIMRVPIWRACSPDFVTQLVLHLDVRVYLPDDYIIRRGETDTEMYMVNRGICEHSDAVGVFDRPVSSLHSRLDKQGSKRGSGSGTSSRRTSGSATSGSGSEFGAGGFGNMQYRVMPITRRRRRHRRTHKALFHAGALSGTDRGLSDSSDSDGDCNDRDGSTHMRTLEARQKRLRRISPGQSFGEMALLMNYKRTVNVRAMTYVEMCILERERFQQILGRYPEDRKKVLTVMLTSCVEKREIPFSWEEICHLVAKKRHVPPLAVIEDGDNLTTDDIVDVLMDAVNRNVPDASIVFGFQDRTVMPMPSTTPAPGASVDASGAQRPHIFRRKRSSRTALMSSGSSFESVSANAATVPSDAVLPASVGDSGCSNTHEDVAPLVASLSASSLLEPQAGGPVRLGQPKRRRSRSQIAVPPALTQSVEQLESLSQRMSALERGQDDMFALMHRLLTSFTRLENEGFKMRKARSDSVLPDAVSIYDRSVFVPEQPLAVGLSGSAPAMEVDNGNGMQLQPASPQSPSHALLSQTLEVSAPSRRPLQIPALLRHRSTQAVPVASATSVASTSQGRADVASAASVSARPGAIEPMAESHSSRARHHHHHQHHHRHAPHQHNATYQSSARPEFFKRGSLSGLRSSASPRGTTSVSATALTDQLWASQSAVHDAALSTPAFVRRTSLQDREPPDAIASIRE